jgi:digeranylgeranylglycerophospholipid reductase
MAAPGYDVVVVGAGPAGSAAARAAAQGGLRVLLIDRRAEVGRPVQCAELVGRLIAREVALPRAGVAHETTHLRTIWPNGESTLLRAPGYVLHRALVDKHLAVLAVQAGAELRLRTTAVARTGAGLRVAGGGQAWDVPARVIIGADGPRSTVGGWLGQRNAALVTALQWELIADAGGAESEIYFAPEYVGGYGWFFPKGETANVGVGVATPGAAPAALALFCERLRAAGRIARVQTVAQTGGAVPVGGLLPAWGENVLLAGDAAGCVHPLTGAGILYALLSGRLAGEAAVEALAAGDVGLLARYPERLRAAIGGPIERGLRAYRALCAEWSADPQALTAAAERHWLTGAGYGG